MNFAKFLYAQHWSETSCDNFTLYNFLLWLNKVSTFATALDYFSLNFKVLLIDRYHKSDMFL